MQTFFLLLSLSTTAALAASNSGSKDCDCYATSSNNFFTTYVFHDFRNISTTAVPALRKALPASADYATGQADESVGTLQTGYLHSAPWTESWAVQEWGKDKSDTNPTRMWNSLSNVYIDKNEDGNQNATSKLVLRTKRWQGYQASSEVENLQKNLFYASVRFRARVVGDSGAVAGLFTYRNRKNESDIEILTRDDPEEIRYSNQPVVDEDGNEIEGSSATVNMNTGETIDGTVSNDKRSLSTSLSKRASDLKWTDWHTHRLDWTEGKTTWFVDGKELHSKTYGAPTVHSYIVLNMWSDGGEWSGKMREGGEAKLEIEWIEMIYNTSGPIDQSDDSGTTNEKLRKRADEEEGCGNVCLVDDKNSDGIMNGGFKEASSAAASSPAVHLSAMLMVLVGGAVLGSVLL